METLRWKRLRPQAEAPRRATPGAAGLDLCACLDAPLTLAPGQLALAPTGVAVEIPEGMVGLLFGRSGLGVKHGVCLSNGVGVIDADYRGEICAGLCNVGSAPYEIQPGERVAQLVLLPIAAPQPEEAEELTETARGAGGFGSTGR